MEMGEGRLAFAEAMRDSAARPAIMSVMLVAAR